MMCRLFAIVAEQPKSPEIPEVMAPFRALSKQHPHGWGIAWYFQGGAQVEKSPTPASEDPRFMTTCASADSNIVLAHLRKLSVGEPSPANTQPFSYGNYIFAHNGTVHAKRGLADMLPPEYRGRLLGETDSEQLFHWILYNIDKGKGRGKAECIRDAITQIKNDKGPGTSSFNFIMSDGERVYAYRSALCRPDHFSLMYRVREPTDKYPGRSVIIASQRLGRGNWNMMDNDSMLTVDRFLNIEKSAF